MSGAQQKIGSAGSAIYQKMNIFAVVTKQAKTELKKWTSVHWVKRGRNEWFNEVESFKMTSPHTNKLSEKQKSILIQLLANFYGNNEVVEYFKLEFKISMASSNVSSYRKNHETEIIEVRKKLGDRLLAIPIANKFYRLEERQKLLDDLKDHLWLEDVKMKNNQIAYDKDGEPIVLKLKGNHAIANQIMDSVKSELEPDKLALTNPEGTDEYTGFTDDKRRLERLIELCDSIRKRRSLKDSK